MSLALAHDAETTLIQGEATQSPPFLATMDLSRVADHGKIILGGGYRLPAVRTKD